jgi:hypothetical protein
MSGARGTASQQQDRRNAADRAGNSRGTAGQQQDRRNAATAQRAGNVAPGVGRSFNPNDRPTNAPFGGMPSYQPRRTQNVTPSYEMSLHNMMALSGMMPGPAMPAKVGMMATGMVPGFQGYQGAVNAPGDYDGPNRFGTQGSTLFPQQQNVQGIQAAGQPKPPMAPPQPAGMSQMQMPAAQLSVPGPSQYGVNLPSYGYFGKPPALQRPKSAIMGGI